MNIPLIMLFLSLLGRPTKRSEIDRIKTKADVVAFLNNALIYKGSGLFWNDAIINPKRPSFHTDTFYKYDVDRNGLTDLVVDASRNIVIFDLGNGKYRQCSVESPLLIGQTFSLKAILNNIDRPPLLIYNDTIQQAYLQGAAVTIDSFIYLYNGFAEYNGNPQHRRYQEISYRLALSRSNTFYTMTINEKRFCTLSVSNDYNANTKDSCGMISKEQYEQLITLLDYADFSKIRYNYYVPFADIPNCYLDINYNDTVKHISDNGMTGTLLLSTIYKQLAAIKDSIKWKPLIKKN